MSEAERLNADCHAALLDHDALRRAMRAQGDVWQGLLAERCEQLFADVAVFVTAAQVRQMYEVIDAVERVVALPGWQEGLLTSPAGGITSDLAALPPSRMASSSTRGVGGEGGTALGVFFGYDFHLNSDGAHLIEINSNAGGGFLNALLLDSQRDALPHAALPVSFGVSLNETYLEMFRNEWRLARGDAPLRSVAIVDEQPEAQYLYPEFLLAQRMFEHAGIAAHIADSAALHMRGDGPGLHIGYSGDGQNIDLVYNRLTDFSLQRHPALHQAYLDDVVVLTPNPAHYARHADKRNLARLTDADGLRSLGASDADIAVLQAGVPQTRLVDAAESGQWWEERKQWFFKPAESYGGKGAYRGANITHRVFEEIMRGGYVAQRMAAPGERMRCAEGGEAQPLKFDVRCYVYDGRVQLVAARLYQGQTTNFRTPGGGFAPVLLVE